jgi:hypothetical protein
VTLPLPFIVFLILGTESDHSDPSVVPRYLFELDEAAKGVEVGVDVDAGLSLGVPGVEGVGVGGLPLCMNLRLRVPVEIDMASERM